MILRKASQRDKNDLAVLRNLMIESVSCEKLSHEDKKIVLDFFRRWDGERPFYLVAEIDSFVVGCIGASFFPGLPSIKNPTGFCAIIHDASVLEDYRRQGIGTELFRGILIECRKRGAGRISLHSSNTGKSIYERFGFKEENNNYPEMRLYHKDLNELRL